MWGLNESIRIFAGEWTVFFGIDGESGGKCEGFRGFLIRGVECETIECDTMDWRVAFGCGFRKFVSPVEAISKYGMKGVL